MDSIFLSYSVGTNPEDYDEQFEMPAEIDLVRVLEGARIEAEPVYCEDIAEVLA